MLFALYLTLKSKNAEKVLLEDVQDRINTLRKQIDQWVQPIHTSLFRQIVKRLQAFGLVSMEIMPNRIIDNVFLQTSLYEDELVTAFKELEYVKVIAEKNQALKDIFSSRDDQLESSIY
jgi:hypothetical protein